MNLTQKVQDEFEIAPLILMMTVVGDDDSCQQTLQADADVFNQTISYYAASSHLRW
ncbi:hypothetical protein N9L33_01650 [Nitrospinae bacterium]|nr:hypothetical protein [Nitrospinota bacterium]